MTFIWNCGKRSFRSEAPRSEPSYGKRPEAVIISLSHSLATLCSAAFCSFAADLGRSTGIPDPNADLGIALPNPEMTLQAYDARVIANIEDRLPLESYAIPVANNRQVVAIRVPNSMSKPHRVQYQGRTYFPSRRERQRYEMDIREIKEMVMRTASRLEDAEHKLSSSLAGVSEVNESCSLIVGCIPVFWQNFMVDVQNALVIQTVSQFHLGHRNFLQPTYNFNGLQRQITANEDSFVQLHRDGMIVLNKRLATVHEGGRVYVRPTAIDIILRAFVGHCSEVYATVPMVQHTMVTGLRDHAHKRIDGSPDWTGAGRQDSVSARPSADEKS